MSERVVGLCACVCVGCVCVCRLCLSIRVCGGGGLCLSIRLPVCLCMCVCGRADERARVGGCVVLPACASRPAFALGEGGPRPHRRYILVYLHTVWADMYIHIYVWADMCIHICKYTHTNTPINIHVCTLRRRPHLASPHTRSVSERDRERESENALCGSRYCDGLRYYIQIILWYETYL